MSLLGGEDGQAGGAVSTKPTFPSGRSGGRNPRPEGTARHALAILARPDRMKPVASPLPAVDAVLAGRADLSFINSPELAALHGPQQLRVLAAAGGERLPSLPNVPTLSESGVKGADVQSWQAVSAPKGLPADIRARMHEALVATMNDPKIRQQFTALGFEIVANTPEQFAAYQQRESARWKQLIETRKITAD